MNQSTTRTTKMILWTGMMALALIPSAMADAWNQRTTFTFSGPVEIPGRTLDAGTYVFKLADTPGARNIIQVFSADERKVLATFIAISDERAAASEKTIITFAERPGDAPMAVKGWFYPGKTNGHEFVYPKKKAVELAHTFHTTVPAMPTELESTIIRPEIHLGGPEIHNFLIAPLIAERPDGKESQIASAFPQRAPVTQTATHEAPQELPAQLPETASPLPLIALGGIVLLTVGAGLRFAGARAGLR